MTRPYKWDWLHRDADGKGLMVGPNCPSCLVRAVAHYRCALRLLRSRDGWEYEEFSIETVLP